MIARAASLLLGCLLLAACGAPALTLYTLGPPEPAAEAPPLGNKPAVIAIARVSIPDELDTEDLVIRDGSPR